MSSVRLSSARKIQSWIWCISRSFGERSSKSMKQWEIIFCFQHLWNLWKIERGSSAVSYPLRWIELYGWAVLFIIVNFFIQKRFSRTIRFDCSEAKNPNIIIILNESIRSWLRCVRCAHNRHCKFNLRAIVIICGISFIDHLIYTASGYFEMKICW